MFRRIDDFLAAWKYEHDMTLQLLRGLTDSALAQSVAPGNRTAGRLAWHLVQSIGMGHEGGLATVQYPGWKAPVPESATAIADQYDLAAGSLASAVRSEWTDETLEEEVPMYGETWSKGQVLSALMLHQAHHRGQLTMVMRQAGLRIPGIYGPTREGWQEMGQPPQP